MSQLDIKIRKLQDNGSTFRANIETLYLGGVRSAKVDELRFELPEEWKNCTVTLHVQRLSGTKPDPQILDENNSVLVDRRWTLEKEGTWMLLAINDSGYIAMTKPGKYTCYDTIDTDTTTENITPSIYEQFVAEVTKYAKQALESMNAAKTSETNAKTSETNAKASADKAKASADSMDASVATCTKKAKEAEASAVRAKTSETNAKTSETNAKTSENAAKTSETNAKASENAAKSSETKSAASEKNARASETAAKQALQDTETEHTTALQNIAQARTAALNDVAASTKTATAAANAATQQATAAAGSASTAARSESAAAGSATEAAGSASAAEESKTAAATSESNAAKHEEAAKKASDEAGAKAGTDKTLSIENAPADAAAVRKLIEESLAAQRAEDYARIKFWASNDPTSPASFIGGTWERVEGEFIMGASSAYPVGTTGGSATHTQTVAEMPSHNHSGSTGSAGSHSHSAWTGGAGGHSHTVSAATATNIVAFPGGTGTNENGQTAKSSSPTTSWVGDHTHGVGMNEAGAHTHTVSIGNTGSGQAMSILNPYYALYIWVRVDDAA